MPRRMERLLAWAGFAALLLVGLLVHDDYGYSWDEQISRLHNGLPNFLYLRDGNRALLKASGEKYHGPAFEIALMALEEGLSLEDTQTVYRVRHLATFLVHSAAVLVFYRLLRARFANRLVGLAGAAFLVLSPRLFADAFYNSKDAPFLDAYVFALASLTLFLRAPSRPRACLHALACGFLIDIRILGVVVPVLTVPLLLGHALARRLRHQEEVRLPWGPLGWYLVLTGVFVTLFWPLLWHNPPHHFWKAFQEMRAYPWMGNVFYLGHEVSARELPWHYAPCWIVITTPPFYSLLFLLGAVCLLLRLLRGPWVVLARRPEDLAWGAAFAVPLCAVVALGSTLYDGWRHLYFLYPAFLYLAVLGLVTLLEGVRTLQGRFRFAVPALLVCCAVPVAATGFAMVRDHPYQNLYFNALAGPDLETIKGRFELDYWGLSCRAGLQQLLALDRSPEILVYPETPPVIDSAVMLPPEQRCRLRFTYHLELADYYVSHYRARRTEDLPGQEFCAVWVGNARVFTARKLSGTHP